MLVPLYGFVGGDTLGVLVLVQDHDSIATVITTLAQATSMRVDFNQPMKLLCKGAALDSKLTVAEARLGPLERVDLVAEVAP